MIERAGCGRNAYSVPVRIGLLGPVTLEVGERSVRLGGPLDRGVLAMLALAVPRGVGCAQLIDGLWAEHAPVTAVKAVQNQVLRLRKSIDAVGAPGPAIVTEARRYRLVIDPAGVDAHLVAHLGAQAQVATRAGDPERAAVVLSEALALWRGPPLTDVEDLPFASAATARLDELRLTCLEARFDAYLACGRHHELETELHEAVAEAPFRERLWCQRMLALHRSGRQADALRVFQRLRGHLIEELGLVPGREATELERAIAVDEASLAWSPPAAKVPASRLERPVQLRPATVPRPRTRFIGRQRDVVEVARVLQATGCTSIVGPAGVGKTRLALEVCARVMGTYPDGIALAELAAIEDGPLVDEVIFNAWGLRGDEMGDWKPTLDTIADRIGTSRCLLVLDNCEHVVDDAARAAEALVLRCPSLHVLSTSREPLRIDGEALWRLAPLAVPNAGSDVTADEVETTASSRLFLDRARLIRPGFSLDGAHAQMVARVVSRLDGLPLALELGAGALRDMELEELERSLDHSYAELDSARRTAPDRHQSLLAAIEWSYRRLGPTDRGIFERMSVFAADFGLGGAVAVDAQAATSRAVVSASLDRLVERSFLQRPDDTSDEGRFRMLDSVRAFARDRLTEHAAPDEVWGPLVRWAIGLAKPPTDVARQVIDPVALATLDREHANLCGALRSAIARRDAASATALGIGLGRYWSIRGRLAEGQRYLDEILDLTDDGDDRLAAPRAEALLITADLWFDDDSVALDLSDRALTIGRRLGDKRLCASALLALGWVHGEAGRFDDSIGFLDEAVRLARQLDDHTAQAIGLERLSTIRGRLGDLETERSLLDESESHLRALGEDVPLTWVVLSQAGNSLRRRQLADARADIDRALVLARTINFPLGEEHALIVSAQLELSRGEVAVAERLLRDSEAIADRTGNRRYIPWRCELLSRIALADGDLARSVGLLRSAYAVSRPMSFARRATVLAAAAGNLADAGLLLEGIGYPPHDDGYLDPQLADELHWVGRLVGAAASVSPTAAGTGQAGPEVWAMAAAALDRIGAEASVVHPPPVALAAS